MACSQPTRPSGCGRSYSCRVPRTLADIAKRVGVSTATVSRVLNGQPGASAATRAAILKVAAALGDKPASRGLAHRARLVGLVLPELSNPIFPLLAEVVAGSLAHRGIAPVLFSPAVGDTPVAGYMDMLLEHELSGVIFAGGMYAQADESRAHYRRLRQKGLPVVVVNATVSGLEFPRVGTDDGIAVEQALGFLRQLGHERVGLVVGPALHVPSDRKAAAFARLTGPGGVTGPGGPGAPLIERTVFSMYAGQVGGDRLIERGATAVICGSDVLALGVVAGARRHGLRVPEDVSVIGFDGSMLLSHTDPPLTSVQQPMETIGRAAVARLVDQIDGVPVPVDEVLFEPYLVVRGSTALRRGR